ncbi:lipopolysaccharide transport periplasmic protein LptA [Ideonella azotifigens]|nr:lipopolysaccharide transport periplasmic protein LptA [Ideonella azotifigens]MCD2340228.1 lipopolysaccharide transport periplasmic protein LptA [Ideonella azotifigens]
MPVRISPSPVHLFHSLLSTLALAAAMLPWQAAQAEKADRNKQIVVESDGKQAASVDLAKKLTILTGNVTITQGTLLIKAERVEVREPQPGFFTAVAFAPAGGAASFRQKRDVADQYVEGQAERIEYDGAAEKVHFIGNAQLRSLRGTEVADRANASTIVYDQRADTVVLAGGGTATPGLEQGRVRMIFSPQPASAPASGAAP